MDFDIVIPKTKSELLSAIRKEKNFRFAAGCTDLLMELRKKNEDNITLINLTQIRDAKLNAISKSAKGIRIGALSTAGSIAANVDIQTNYPVLSNAAINLASTQIRQIATIGGNMCTASPSGDIACAIVALKSTCEALNTTGKTKIIKASDFFIGVRKTALKKNELLYGITIPVNNKKTKHIHSGFIKVGTRRSMECSVVSLAYHIQYDEKGIILDAGVAIGASAPTIRFAQAACDFIIGKNIKQINDKDKREFAEKILTCASPITDLRATAWYRKEVLFNISKSVLE